LAFRGADVQAQRGVREHLCKPGAQQRMILQQDSLHGFLVLVSNNAAGRARQLQRVNCRAPTAARMHGVRPSKTPESVCAKRVACRYVAAGARGAESVNVLRIRLCV
jgi:hypothetical protein